MNAAVGRRKAAYALAGMLAWGAVASAQDTPPDKSTAPPATAPAAGQSKSHAAQKGEAGAAMKAPTNSKAQASYSLGVVLGMQLHEAGLTNESVANERLSQGLRDALSGKAKPSPQDQQSIMSYIQSVRAGLADTNRAAAKTFLAENARKKDIVTTASGLEYHVINAGSGQGPKPTDEVTVNYRGTLLDGTEFDSSYKRGQPATFPVNGVIPGWREALVLMKPGAKWQLFIPPNLAYDERSPPPIPPGSMLIFDVEMIGVKPAKAAPAPGPGAGPGTGPGAGPGAGAGAQVPPPK
ncbi:MAG TPA: FKBP-type peptidyl-prolyl cis-trans isomerase [Steroidobacteraceae bacterium]|nr:FKBP-type peptidyl-prolyl cis-trans isomerase [Steroidobacteraceae bacterium]